MRYPEKLIVHPFEKIAGPKTFSLILSLSMVLPLASSVVVLAETHAVKTTIDVSKTGAPISKNIYGQFLEHGGDIANTGVWSEMPVDRKFFYPVAASAPTPPPVMGNAAGNPRFRRISTRWRMAPATIDAIVQVDKNPEVQVEEQALGALPETIIVRPFSVNIYSYPVQ